MERPRVFGVVIGALVALGLAGFSVSAQEFEVLVSIDNPPLGPMGGLVIGPDGLYGVAGGGSYDYGALYRFVPPVGGTAGSLSKLYSFPDTDYELDLGQPFHGLVLASDGSFYGTRQGGSWSGYAALYRYSTTGEQTLMHFFNWPDDGANPSGPLVEVAGALYGTCRWGGDADAGYQGTIFKYSLADGFSPAYAFSGLDDGGGPMGGLVLRPQDGMLYGTTTRGGAHARGTIFRFDPASDTVETLHSFDPATDGSSPLGELAVGPDGILYGAATYGDDGLANCGRIFSFDPDAVTDRFAVLQNFPCAPGETKHPIGGMVVLEGFLYGVTLGDDIPARVGDGSVYRVELASNVLETLRTFHPDASYLGQLTIGPDGLIYGQNRDRGLAGGDAGGIFSIQPADGVVSDLHLFGPTPGPRKPFSLIEDVPGSVVVASRQGGAANLGTIFRLTPGDSPQVLYSFSDGGPYTSDTTTFLTRASDGLLYGTRSNGGAEGGGSIFTLDEAGTYTELHAFDRAYPHSDSRPRGALTESRTEPGVFFGTLAGSGLDGSVYRIDSVGNLSYLAVLQSWDGSPRGRLHETENGTLYGVIAEWYDISGYGYGAIFRSSTAGGFDRFKDFSWSEGNSPEAGLTARPSTGGGGTALYGVASSGGAHYEGTVFKLSPSEEFSVVHSFDGDDGAEPFGELVLAADGQLYGTTRAGGQYGYGTIFSVTGDDQIVTRYNFDHTTGAAPESALITGTDGNLYGTTVDGGTGGGGTVFRFNLAPSVSIAGPSDLDEGTTVTLTASGNDPQGGAVDFAWDLDHDGDFDDGVTASVDFSATTPERDGDGSYPVSVRATDSSGVATTATTTLMVQNIAPSVTIEVLSSANCRGADASIEVKFVDPGPDSWTATVDWGDGTVETVDPATSPFTAMHAFSAPGASTATVTVEDDDGGSGSADAVVSSASAAAEIEDLIADIEALVEGGDLNRWQGGILLAPLRFSLLMVERGADQLAIGGLHLFNGAVNILVRIGVLDPDVGASLIARADAAIECLS